MFFHFEFENKPFDMQLCYIHLNLGIFMGNSEIKSVLQNFDALRHLGSVFKTIIFR